MTASVARQKVTVVCGCHVFTPYALVRTTRRLDPVKPPPPRHLAMSWAQRLKRVFGIEIDTCARCNGKLKIIASIEEPAVIARILAHLERIAPEQYPIGLTLVARSAGGLFGVLVIFGIEVEVEPPD